ncbi:cytosolic protein [Peptoniphilus porci]|uniref:Cytosolic protein n=2 Tax=Peptoniphilus porci TaxID=2652280 RepID=A0A1U7M0X6_9FIRM|nr:cytosolic protein [Peptoniphilus porci]
MKDIIKGAYDLHVHSAPDILPRKFDDLEMAQRIIDSGMAGFAAKSHYFCTAERAKLVNKLYPDCNMVGAISLNSSVGGINPMAVEMAARAGTKIVWFPTCDSKHEQSFVFNDDPNKKLPYWASIVIQLKEDGINYPTYRILDETGKLIDEVYEILDIIAKYDMILATGHLSHEETFALVEEASKRGVEKIIITHVTFPTTFYDIEEQKRLIKYGAYMEHCYTTYSTNKVDFSVMYEQIKAVGTDNVILATDLGQSTALYPDEGLYDFAMKLIEAGIDESDVRDMIVKNPADLLGL